MTRIIETDSRLLENRKQKNETTNDNQINSRSAPKCYAESS